MRIAICEDNPEHAEMLADIVQGWARRRDVQVALACYKNAEEFLFHWAPRNTFDLVFLDIDMGGSMNGMELARRIRRQDQAMLIVFTTGLRDYVLRGYEVQAHRYMLKPIRERECWSMLDGARKAVENQKSDTFIMPLETEIVRIHRRDIMYFEMDNHHVNVKTTRGDFRYKARITDLEKELPEPAFCRCHRSCIVNMLYVRTITHEQVQLDNGKVLPVSRAKWPLLNECFVRYYQGQTMEQPTEKPTKQTTKVVQ